MKAVRVTEYGEPDVLRVEEVSLPAIGAGQLLLRVLACGVNPLDAWFRSGHLAARFARDVPYTPGVDVVGEVVSVAPDVTEFGLGDRVFGVLPVLSDGGYAEFAAAPASALVPLPHGLDPVRLAGGLTPGITGVQVVNKAIALSAGRRMLVLGALGSVGRVAVAAARAKGIAVTALVQPGHAAEAETLGVAQVEDGSDPARIAGLGQAFDAIIDTAGPDVVLPWENAIVDGGAVVSVVPLAPASFTRTDVTYVNIAMAANREILVRVAAMIGAGEINSPELVTVDLAGARTAHDALLTGGGGRKYVVVPGAGGG